MSIQGIRAKPESMRSIDSATFIGSYQAIGGSLDQPAALVKFVNNSDVSVTISWDGIDDHDIMPPNSFVLYDIETNSGSSSRGLSVPVGTQFYVKGAAGVGLVYLVVIYIVEQ